MHFAGESVCTVMTTESEQPEHEDSDYKSACEKDGAKFPLNIHPRLFASRYGLANRRRLSGAAAFLDEKAACEFCVKRSVWPEAAEYTRRSQ